MKPYIHQSLGRSLPYNLMCSLLLPGPSGSAGVFLEGPATEAGLLGIYGGGGWGKGKAVTSFRPTRQEIECGGSADCCPPSAKIHLKVIIANMSTGFINHTVL